MKNFKRITAALLIVISLIVTALPFSAEATSAAPLVYSKDSNSGTRHVVCTTLEGTSADDYYTGSYTYEELEKLSGTELFSALQTLMRTTHTTVSTYDDCKYEVFKVDCENNDTGHATTLYTGFQMTLSGHWYNGGWKCDREHVWPRSLGGKSKSDGGADLHHIRPTEKNVNGTRGNKLYGYADAGSVYGNLSGDLGGRYTGTYFEPADNVKGDVARICLYLYVRWNSNWGCTSIEKVFQSKEVLLEWCEMDPVDTWEMGRNEVVEAFQGNRNVFIDYPELAWLMLGYDIPEGMITPSGKAKDSNPSCPHTTTEIRNKADATCGEDGYTGDTYCKSCGEKISSGTTIAATGNHDYNGWENNATQHWQECTVCQNEGTLASHAYDNNCDTSCNICGFTRTTSHTYDNGTVTKEPTASAEGEKTFTCTVCGSTKTEAVPKLDQPVLDTSIPETSTSEEITTDEITTDEITTDVSETEPPVSDVPTTDASETEPNVTTPEMTDAPETTATDKSDNKNNGMMIIIIAVAIVAAGAVVTVVLLKKKK